MKIQSIALAAVAVLAVSSAFATAPQPKAAQTPPAPRAETLLEDIAAGVRDVLRAVAPEVSLPKVEIKLPPFDGAPR